MAKMVEAKGGFFVDAAMVGSLPKYKHQVPMLLSGAGAKELQKRAEPLHMKFQYISEIPGQATSIKFIRSIVAKGLPCLLIEALEAAQKFGVEKVIVEGFEETYGNQSFEGVINRNFGSTITHAERREHEMDNVLDLLHSEGLPDTMSQAAKAKLQWIQSAKLKDRFPNGLPNKWQEVLAAWGL
jgi:3-hydroxyisobutyrate dehydrogenase-like beta-hydroxyacid dehydrogenase